MKATGIVRRVDVLGRVVVPKEIRKIFNIEEGDPLEIFTEKDGIILKKYSPISNMNGLCEDVCIALNRATGRSVFVCDKDAFLSASGNGAKEIISKDISLQLRQLISEKQTLHCAFEDGSCPIKLYEEDDISYFNQLISPITHQGEGVGALIIADRRKENKISALDFELTNLAVTLLSARYK